MHMKEFTPKEFESILLRNGFHLAHYSSNHKNYKRDGFERVITVNFHERLMNRCIARRLLKECGIEI
jgi:predicted RNA binding protein YcfA (HicA-like mRNA interferase family)